MEAPKGHALIRKDGLVGAARLTVETNLRFRDGLVWTVGLDVGIKLRFQIYIWSIVEGALAWCLSAY